MYWHLRSPRWLESSCRSVAWQPTWKAERWLVTATCLLDAIVENRRTRLIEVWFANKVRWLGKRREQRGRIGRTPKTVSSPRWLPSSLVYWQSGRHIYKGERGWSEITRVEQGQIRPLFQLKWDAFCQAAILRVVFCFLFFTFFVANMYGSF